MAWDDLDQRFGVDRTLAQLDQWDTNRFQHIGILREALWNGTRIEICEDLLSRQRVAVKAMPTSWTCESPEAFRQLHRDEVELPWRDIGAMRTLSLEGSDGVCGFVGVFLRRGADGDHVCLVMEYCAGGDLFSLLERELPSVGPPREARARTFMRKLFSIVADIHARNISHGDLSLENALLNSEDTSPRSAVIKLIDFGACSGPRARGARGKPSYQAPEVHNAEEYDAFASDMFALGVMCFTLAIGNYPWRSTKHMICNYWRFHCQSGFHAYMAKRKVQGQPASSWLSPELMDLLEALFSEQPSSRPSAAGALRHPWFSTRLLNADSDVE